MATFNHAAAAVEARARSGSRWSACEVACVDDQDEPVPAGERGEVVIRGHNIMKGYYKRPEATAEAMRNGWFHTRRHRHHRRGRLSVDRRSQEGHDSARRIQRLSARARGDADDASRRSRWCAVVGVPDERLGEEVKAFIVRQAGRGGHRGRDRRAGAASGWPPTSAPRFVEFRDQLPMGATGKVLKRELRVQVAAVNRGRVRYPSKCRHRRHSMLTFRRISHLTPISGVRSGNG